LLTGWQESTVQTLSSSQRLSSGTWTQPIAGSQRATVHAMVSSTIKQSPCRRCEGIELAETRIGA
jgi:hypothetical protein